MFNTKTWSWRLRLHNIKKMLVCLKYIKREMDSLYFPVKNVEDSSWLARGSNLVKCCQCKRLLCLQVVSKFLVIQSQDKVYNTIYCKSFHKVLIWLDWGFVILQTNDFNKLYGRVCMFSIPDRLLGWYSFGCWYCWWWSWWWSAKCYFAFRFRPSPNKLCLMNLKKTWICMRLEITLYICI